MIEFLKVAYLPYHMMYFQHFEKMVDNKIIWLFVWVIIIDIGTGFTKSLVTHKTTSSKGTIGLIKHGVLLLIILTLYPMLDINGFRSAADTFTIFYILFYAVSILENLGQMGIPIPQEVKKYIYKLSDEYEEEREKNDGNKHS